MRRFDDPRKDDSYDRDAELSFESEGEDRGDALARPTPGKRTRTMALVELMHDPRRSPILRQARDRAAPPPIPRAHVPAASQGFIGTLYRKAAGSPEGSLADKLARARSSSGRALPAKLRRRLEMALGADLKDVRVHTGRDASDAARSAGALAFTLQRDIYFADGQYNPDSERGQKLIAHEAAHTVQQRSAATPSASADVPVSSPSDRYEVEADRFADRFVDAAPAGGTAGIGRGPGAAGPATPIAPISKGVLSRAIIHRKKSPVSVIAESIGSDENKAKDALRKAGGNRGVVEQAIRQNFEADEAKEIIESVAPGAGEKPPEVKNKDAKAEKKSQKPDSKGGEQGGKGKSGGKPAAGEGGKADAAGKPGKAATPQADGQGDTISSAELQLIYQELVEHEAWSQARSQVGDAGSVERAAFIAQSAGQGAMSGFATGAVMGAATGIVGQLASRYVPIPGVGAIIAGGFAAYGLLTKDWAASFDTIGKFGEGSSTYETLANSIASISEIIDIIVNVMNVIAGVIGVISALMWLISIITVGAASPLAGTLSSIALAIVTVTGILDNINNLILQPCVLLFRALHTFTTDADPREVEQQGAGISDAANKAASALGGIAGGKAADAAGARAKRWQYKRAQARAAGGDSVSVDGPSQATTTGVDTPAPRADADVDVDAPAPRADADADIDAPAPRADADADIDAPAARTDADADAPAPRSDADADAQARPDADADAQARPDADAQARADEAARAGQDVQSRWDRFKDGVRQRRDALKREFTDSVERARQAELDHQRRLDEAESRAREQRGQELDAEHEARTRQADEDFESAVQRGREDAEVEADNLHRRDLDDAKAERYRSKADADRARQRENFEASRRYNDAKSDAVRELNTERGRIRDERSRLRQEYDSARQRLRDADAGPEAQAALRQQYEADRAALRRDLEAAEQRYSEQYDAASQRYQQERAQARQRRDQAHAEADTKYEADAQRAGELRETRRQELEDAAQRQAEADRDAAHGDAERYRESKYRDRQLDRSGRRAVNDERRRLRNQDRFGQDEDTRGVTRKLWDFFSNKAGREDTRKAFAEARSDRARQRQAFKDARDQGRGRLEAEVESLRSTHDDRQLRGDVTGGVGGIANLIKPTVEKGAKWAVGQDRKTEEEKKKAEKEKKQKGFWERNIHPALYDPGKYWGQGGWKAKHEQSQKDHAGRFTADNQAKTKRERVNPGYAPPPGRPEQLAEIQKYIEQAYQTKAKAEAAERDAKLKKAKAEGDAPAIKKLTAEADKAKQVSDQHQASVKQKQQANQDQKKRQANAESTINQYASRSAGIAALTTPLAAFKTFTWIGRKLGSDSFAKMEQDADNLIAKFAEMKLTMSQQQKKQPANKAKLDTEGQRIDATDQKAKKSKETLDTAGQDAKTLDETNQKKIQEGGAAVNQAAEQKSQYDGKAKSGEQAYAQLRSKLVTWAQGHKAAREAAIAKQLGKDPGSTGGKASIPAPKPAGDAGPAGGGRGGGGPSSAEPDQAAKADDQAAKDQAKQDQKAKADAQKAKPDQAAKDQAKPDQKAKESDQKQDEPDQAAKDSDPAKNEKKDDPGQTDPAQNQPKKSAD